MNKILKYVINGVCIAAIGTGLIVGNQVLKQFETEIDTALTPKIVDSSQVDVSSQNGQALSKRIMEEGAVLLHNENNTLPLNYNDNKKVNVFGWRSIDWIYGSEGQNASGGVAPETDDISKNIDIYKALNDYGIQYNEKLFNMYNKYQAPNHQSENLRGTHINTLTPLIEPKIDDKAYYTDELLSYSKEYSSTAIVVISRMAGEGMECSTKSQGKKGPGAVSDTSRHYLEISTEEEELLKYVGQNYQKVVVLINAANPLECGFLKTIPGIGACMYIGFTGTRGASAIPSLLYGDMSPSGKTVDTFAYDFFTNPGNVFVGGLSYTDFGRSYTDYVEGVYVGYKWYETANVEGMWNDVNNEFGKGYDGVVQFPFGYGKSYSTFEWTVGEMSIKPESNITDQDEITIPVTVKNTGNYPARDVVEAYVTAPYTKGGIEKASVNLVGFTKTNLLQPNQEETVELKIDVNDFTSYDCYDKNNNNHKGYELEKGLYSLKLMTDCHNIKTVKYNSKDVEAKFNFNVSETINIDKDKITGKKVGNLFTGEDAIDIAPIDANDGEFVADIPWFTRENFMKVEDFSANRKPRAVTPSVKTINGYSKERALAWDNATTDEFGDPVNNNAVTWGANNGLKLFEGNSLTELGQKLGEDYNAEEWNKLLDQLSIEDAVNLINNYYGSKAIASIGKPFLADFDGPAQIKGFVSGPRGTGYPTMVVIAATWNPKLAYEFGKSYGDDMKTLGVNGVWGWAIDSHRSSFFGRNHESPSEDAMLAGTIVTNAVKGLSTRGRYCFLKHFALYGYEGENVWCTEQALREIYLKPFRKAFVEGGALGCMTTYTGVGGEHSETTIGLLTGVLRKEWDFKGAITTDYIGYQPYCDSLIRCGGNLGMGCKLGTIDGVSYTTSSSNRIQNRLKDAAHQTIYMWLRAEYNEREYLKNPDAGDNYIASFSMDSWCWWKPLVTCLNVTVTTGLVLWAILLVVNELMKNNNVVNNKEEEK